MSNGPNGLTVLLEGALRPTGLAGSIVFEGATEQETQSLLDTGLPEALIVDPAIPWHRTLAEKAHAMGAAVVAVGARPPPPAMADEWVTPTSDGAEITSRLELAAARARARRRQLRHANTDPLTGLPNRRGLLCSAMQVVARARRAEQKLALVLIDLDGFKAINDELGHLAGDRTLRQLGVVLHKSARHDEVVGRLGGDEFALILAGDELQARQARERLLSALSAAGISASAGFAVGPAWRSLKELYDEADATLRGAKERAHRGLPRRLPNLHPHAHKEVESNNSLRSA
jgi:diguanylate cyclase (GGDEF)-like protein